MTMVQTIPPSSSRGRFEIPRQLVRSGVPLSVRLALVRFLGRQRWLAARNWWAQELLRDFAQRDPNGYHRFMWSNHLGYADTYEIALRFGAEKIHATRRMLFDDLIRCLGAYGIQRGAVDSIFEIGCSLGYNLRFLEQHVFTRASRLEGCDIDAYAVEHGRAYLQSVGSRVNAFTADMAELDSRLGDQRYDVTFCAGVLMYLAPSDAERVVGGILRHTGIVAAFAGLADPEQDNATLSSSRIRARDGSFVHDIDGMVVRAGGHVVQRRWEGPRSVDGNTVYFVFAEPGRE